VDRDEQQAANTTPPEHDQDLMRLKYVLYKNLSTIHRKQNFNYTKALDFLIQAAKIDDTDRCVWYEIGENALHLNKHMIARYAFEQTLSIDPGDWFSLDNLVVILYALGNYSHCLNYVIQSLKLDKFYVNGLIAMKLLTKLNDSYLDKQIEMFVEGAYTMCGIELDSYLSQLDEELYDSFMTRVESIKGSHKRQLFEICNNQGEFQSHELNLEVKVTNKIYRLDFVLAF
jgi:tetratricopeptide (TPR) repeat protein